MGYIPVDALDQLSAQLAAMSESAKRWVPDETFQAVGENIGVHNTTELANAREAAGASNNEPDHLTSHPKGHRWPL